MGMGNIFSLGDPSKKDQDEEFANALLNWSKGYCTKEDLEREHGDSFDWFGEGEE